MKLQARLLLVYSALFIGAVGFIIFQRALDISRSHTVLESELKSHKTYLSKLMSLEGNQIASLALDYSFWDEMVTFVHQPSLDWAQQNIDTALSTFDADAAWVYNTNDKLVYYSTANGDNSATNINLPAAAFTKLYKDHFDHFYVQEPSGLMEIRADTIVPTSDYAHTTTPQGYWLVGRYVSSSYVQKMSDLAQSSLALEPASSGTADKIATGSISFGVALTSWDGTPLKILRLTAPVPVEQDLENLYNRELLLLILFFVASSVLVVSSTWILVLRPVKTISAAIATEKPETLDHVAASTTEFGDLAQVVQLSFRQKLKINESEFLKTKLEELNQAKSEFLAIAAHELRGPVGNINIFSANLGDLVDDKELTPDTLIREVDRIQTQAHKANVLINDMYQASKGGRALDFKKHEFSFDDFIRGEVENAQYSTNQKLSLEGHTGQKLVSDPDRLGQVMTNLIRNASKYSPNDKPIVVRLSRVANEVQVEVQDFGLGIDQNDQQHLFQRFYRSSRVSKDYPGLGLGLSVCKEIIEGLGGKIWLESQLGNGSHFYFTLPIDAASWELT